MEERLYWDFGMDGVELCTTKPHGTQVAVLRCVSANPLVISRALNVKLVLIIPGPRAPKFFAAFMGLILGLFAEYGPTGNGLI